MIDRRQNAHANSNRKRNCDVPSSSSNGYLHEHADVVDWLVVEGRRGRVGVTRLVYPVFTKHNDHRPHEFENAEKDAAQRGGRGVGGRQTPDIPATGVPMAEGGRRIEIGGKAPGTGTYSKSGNQTYQNG